MLKKLLLSICILLSLTATAQKEANNWYFGEHAGISFNSGSPVALTDGMLDTDEGCATISDSDGNLLFYTDGVTVYNASHAVMQNGTGLLGDTSSTNSAIIVPKPNNANIYYIFTVETPSEGPGLRYSEVDLSLNGGLGAVTVNKNILLIDDYVTEKLSAVGHKNGTDYWVVGQEVPNKALVTFHVSSLGVNTTPVVNNVSNGPIAGQGVLKFSPDGKRLAMAITGYGVELFDFNTATGQVFNARRVLIHNFVTEGDDYNYYGLEFSPKGNLLYASEQNTHVFQLNLKAGSTNAIVNSKLILFSNGGRNNFGTLQLGPDGIIYVARDNQAYLDVIQDPNTLGLGCNYTVDAVSLSPGESTFGLPPFIQSYFYVGAFDFENTCFGDTTKFSLIDTVDSVVWNFDDPNTGLNNTSTDFEPTHIFSNPGIYNVTLTASVDTETATTESEVVIHEAPSATQPSSILACDTDNDGFFSFNLKEQDLVILNGQDPAIFEVVYYASMADYAENSPILNSLNYINIVAYASETITAVVRNKSNTICDARTDFNIQAFKTATPNQNIPRLAICDNTSVGTDSDGIVQFDLTQKETEILDGQLPAEFQVRYYTDASFSSEILNPNSYINTNRTETIYVQVSNKANPLCIMNTQFDLEVFELPITPLLVELKQCDDDLDGFSLFNLNEVIDKVNVNAVSETITFHETFTDANSGDDAIQNLETYVNKIVSHDIIWARAENANKCYRTTQVNLIVSTTQIPITYTKDIYACDDGTDTFDGVSTFDFSQVNAEIEALFPVGQQLIIKYYKNQPDALSETNPIMNINNYQNNGYPDTHDVFIRVDSALDNDCLGLGHHITLHVEKQPIAHAIIIPEQCDDEGDGMFAFETSNIENAILNGQMGMTVSYVNELGNALPSPLPNPFVTSAQMVTAFVTNSSSQDMDGACFDETTLAFKVDAASVAYPIPDLIACDEDNNGQVDFDTSNIETTVLNGQSGMHAIYTDENNHLLPSPLPNPFSSSSQTITVRVENTLSNICFDETSFNLVVVEQPVLNMNDTWLICEGDSVDVFADAGYDEYLWSTGETSHSITIYKPGNYEVTARNVKGDIRCETSKKITVVASNIATITNIETKDWTQNENVITVFVEGQGDYEFSLDDIIYQDSNTFTGLKIDDYTVYVRDKKGCGIETEEVFLMYYPKYFTPNNDGYHDTWQIYNSNLEPNNTIYIYDRYGKLLKELNPNSIGWDGTAKGERMTTSDYWFVIYRQNGKQYRGHFTLKR